jgi:polyribonucleotide nucleotidyltransferase
LVTTLRKTEKTEHLFQIQPVPKEIFHTLDIVASQFKDKTVMIEAGALQVTEDVLVGAVEKAHTETVKIIEMIEDLVKQVGQKKLEVSEDAFYMKQCL